MSSKPFSFLKATRRSELASQCFAVHLVAPDVEVGVGEEARHLAEEAVEEAVDLFSGGSRAGSMIPHSRSIAYGPGIEASSGWPTNQLVVWPGMSNSGYHADAAVRRVGDDSLIWSCV